MSKSSRLFQTLEIEAFRAGITPRTAQSREWFRKQAMKLRQGRLNRDDVMNNDPIVTKTTQLYGSMMMFYYDPKWKKQLPFYDKFPLVIVLDKAKDGFMGLNLHYLPPVLRAKFLDAILDTTSDTRYTDSTRFDVTYQLLKRSARMRYFKPCIKHYLTSQVRSKFAFVPAPEWEIAVFLPLAQWEKASAMEVYNDSRKKITNL